jgi:RNA polymerase sigma-70 factor (ECF subfamily)
MTGEFGATPSGFSRERLLADLVRDMASGDQQALARLYDETSALLNGLLLRMLNDREDAEEALLDVYMKAWKHAPRYSPEKSAVQPWLVMMARGIAIDRIRRRQSQPKPVSAEIDWETAFASEESPERDAIRARDRERVGRFLHCLSAEQREVVLLAFFAGYTHSELAEKLGQPLGTVKTRIRSALTKLRESMESTDVAGTA